VEEVDETQSAPTSLAQSPEPEKPRSKHPVLQFMEGENIKLKSAITSTAWLNKMMLPGEFEVRILFDENNNGKWDAGDYSKKLQPEITLALPQKISIKADWENERDIDLK
jgi:hypothetical protein